MYASKHSTEALFTLHRKNLRTEPFTQKTHQMFCVHTAPEELLNAIITGNFGIVVEEVGQGFQMISLTLSFTCSFSVHIKR